MADEKKTYGRFAGGIADSIKEGSNGQIPNQFYFGRSINYRDDPQAITLLPGALKESGTVIVDLLKCADTIPTDLSVYAYGNAGTVYKRTSAGSWSALRTVANSHGNGVGYFTGDDYLYYLTDKTVGRYGPISGTPQFVDDMIASMGGARTNTYSATFTAASSQYASAVDSASLSLTGNLTLECYINPNSLPTTGNQMILMSKWRAGNNTRSYKFDIAGIAAVFGDGTDGNLTISVNTTEAPIDSACTGTQGAYTLSATNAAFAAGQQILVHQSQGANAGTWQRTSIVSYTAGTITTADALSINFVSGAQVRTLPKYGNVTVNNGVTWTCKAWNGTVGGIMAFLCNGTLTITGNINANGGNSTTYSTAGLRSGRGTGGGFYGGNAYCADNTDGYSNQGEGTSGAGTTSRSANGNGGGGAGTDPGNNLSGGGAGGGNGTVGDDGTGQVPGTHGGTSSNTSLTTMTFGGGGGGGECRYSSSTSGGGSGGGIIFAYASTIATITGSITANGGSSANSGHSGGGGAGGSILLKCLTADLGSGLVTANGGTGGTNEGGNGGSGRIHVDYYTSVTGTTYPTLDSSQDNNLANNTTYQLRLSVSNNGTANEIMARTCSLTTGAWKHVAVTWTAASHISEFFLNGNSLGTSNGAITAISDNASSFLLASQDTDLGSYFDGQMDEVRVWNLVRASSDIYNNKDVQISPSSNGLKAYWQLNNSWSDATSSNNTLTPANAPTFTTNTPFLGLSTRMDIDLSQTATGQTYSVPTTISETIANKVSIVPQKEPLKSISVKIAAVGTGDWTLTLHDSTNTVVASKTVTNANLIVGDFEFVFATAIRPIINATYHFHVTSTVGDGTVVTNTTSDFSTVQYYTYFQTLVTDTLWHPAIQFQYQPLGGTLTGAMIFGNERYLAVWDGANYFPNFLTLAMGWKVRCFAQWRQYLAIGVWRGNNIYDFDRGRIYFWSGYQPAYDFFIDVPEGQINAMFGVNSDLYIYAGFRGILMDYKGGYFTYTGNSSSGKLKRMPLLEQTAFTEVYPGAINMYRGMIHAGLYANSDSTTSQRGVYSYGTLNQYYPDSLSYDYPISTGSRGSTVNIGLVYPIGKNLLIGWQDGTAYGCDVVNFNNPPAPNGEIILLLDDGGTGWKDKDNLAFRVDNLALKTGESLTPEINFDRLGMNTLNVNSTVGSTFTTQPLSSGRASEVQLGCILTQTNGTSPTLIHLTLAQDPLKSEEIL
jgi:hypothetical protein